MKEIRSKKDLEIVLSKLKGFEKPEINSEQYVTPSSIAAEVIWKAYFNEDVKNKKIADLGAGTGILGIGCLIMGAKDVFFIESDRKAMEICKENVARMKSEDSKLGGAFFYVEDVTEFNEPVNTVIMNPPFGTQKKHADREFLMKAFSVSNVVYSFHKTATEKYITNLALRNGFIKSESFMFDFMLKNTMRHHEKSKEFIKVSCLIFRKA